MDTVESAQLLCNYTKHQSYHQLLGSGCLPFTWANRSVPVWANGRQNSGLVNFALESQSLFEQISSIYQKTATKPWNWYQRWLWRNVTGISVWNVPTHSDIPLLPEIFHWNDPKSHVPTGFFRKLFVIQMVKKQHLTGVDSHMYRSVKSKN